MQIVITEESTATLREHGQISIAFEVERVLEVQLRDAGLGGVALVERRVEVPYVKDYDAVSAERPSRWAERFDLSRWGILAAHIGGERVGGVVIAADTPGVDLLGGRRDRAVIWDLRVSPALRGRGIGHALFRAASAWAAERGCRQLRIETQNVNVPACRFYVRQGCGLVALDRQAYPDHPDEVQLIWGKELPASG